jgi:hypothetical protein
MDVAFRAYRSLVEECGNMQRQYFTKDTPSILATLEKVEKGRVACSKVAYSRYAANSYSIIPTTREICDKLILFTDRINSTERTSQFVQNVLQSLKGPLQLPRVPRLKLFGDASGDMVEDPSICALFEKTLSEIQEVNGIDLRDKDYKPPVLPTVSLDEVVEIEEESRGALVIEKALPEGVETSEPTNEVNPPPVESETTHSSEVAKELESEKISLPGTSVGWINDVISGTDSVSRDEGTFLSTPFAGQTNFTSSFVFPTNSFKPASAEPIAEPVEVTVEENLENLDESLNVQVPHEEESWATRISAILAKTDFYTLLESTSASSLDEISAKRKEINRRLHPDNFVPNSEEKNKAVELLVRVNDVYSSVFRNAKTKTLYDKLCAYRNKYSTLSEAPDALLQRAITNLNLLGRAVLRTNLPSDLQEEIDLVLLMVKETRGIVPAK